MGFIDYHGRKEDGFDELRGYLRDQQEADLRKKRAARVKDWLRKMTGSSQYMEMSVRDLLRLLAGEYQTFRKTQQNLKELSLPSQQDQQLWLDFNTAFLFRHLHPFHLQERKEIRYLQTFETKICRLSAAVDAEKQYQLMTSDMEYRRYMTGSFDPTGPGQQFFRYLYTAIRDKSGAEAALDRFLMQYIKVSLLLGVYLYQMILPEGEEWMRQIAAERAAVLSLQDSARRDTLLAPDQRHLVNPAVQNQKIREAKVASDRTVFRQLLEKGGIDDYTAAAKLLLKYELPEEIAEVYISLVQRLPILKDAVQRFDDIYHADLDTFQEYYAPEALKLTAVYLDYQTVRPSDKILDETRKNVFLTVKKLLQVVNDTIEEIYRFAKMDANAEAKAVEALMSQDGHVDPEFTLRKGDK